MTVCKNRILFIIRNYDQTLIESLEVATNNFQFDCVELDHDVSHSFLSERLKHCLDAQK